MTDSETGRTTTYYYDFICRNMKYVESGTGYSHSVGYEYDEKNMLTAMVETINGKEKTTSYTYDDDDRITSVTNGNASKSYTYDSYGRTSTLTTKHGSNTVKTDTFGFMPRGTTSQTSSQIKTHTVNIGGTNTEYIYTYDANGNITSITGGGNTVTYAYDSANQLIREDNLDGDYTHTWTYDNAGNILTRTEYDYASAETDPSGTGETVTYTYDRTSDWGDVLRSYDGQALSYDSVGNLTDDGTWKYDWQHGRQLDKMTEKADDTKYWDYTYNADGLRTKRTNGTKTYEYIYNGSQLSQMTVDGKTLYFAYDSTGTPLSVNYNGTTYYYVTNIQGDVTAILNSSGTEVVSYTYDTWGNPLATTGSLADDIGTYNPLRYRGYVYDQETGFYYLQSRYYNPEIGRFINADDVSNLGAEDSIVGLNIFAYCSNNPANRFDGSGNASLPNWAKIAIGVGIIAAAAAVTIATGGAAAGTVVAAVHCVAHGALVGAVTQGAIGAVSGAASGAITHRLTTGSWEGAANAAVDGAATGFMTGTITGAISGAVSSPYCFVAGTTVLTAAGTAAIETIQKGDMVWAWDEETGDVALKEVVETYINETDELIHVHVNGEEIITTPSHPFYSPVKGWTNAVHLRAGDILVLVNGEYVVVEKVQHEILEAPIAVYNFQVEDYHTYYVTDIGVLVHNVCKNTGGRHGGEAHRTMVNKVKDSLSSKGWDVSVNESRVYLGNGKYRYPDIIAQKNGITRFYQIGKQTLSGKPVARELRALRDLSGHANQIFFIPYNV